MKRMGDPLNPWHPLADIETTEFPSSRRVFVVFFDSTEEQAIKDYGNSDKRCFRRGKIRA